MSRTIVVISELIDATIREGQPDTTFIIKHSMAELAEHIETTPIRADYLYFTQDVIPHTNTSLNFLTQMLENPFLKVDKVCYVTEKGAREIESVRYIVAEKKYDNWEIIEGALTREYVTGVITGTLRTDSFNRKRKALYRVPRAAYVQDRIKNSQALEEPYEDDERFLKDVPPVEVPESTIFDSEDVARIVHVAGNYGQERTALAFLLAQYLSQEEKTLIVEKDVEYHMLTEFVTKSGAKCLQMELSEMLEDMQAAVKRIISGTENLVVVTCVDRIQFSYNFICNVLYANLSNHLGFMVREDDMNEVPPTQSCIVAVPSNIIGCLQVAEQVDTHFVSFMKFVGVNLQQLPETQILNSKTIDTVMSDVLEAEIKGSSVVNIFSLKIGGDDTYDLRSIVGE